MIELKTPEEISHMKRACVVVARLLDLLKNHVSVGIKTKELDSIASDFIRKEGAQPAFLGYRGFPATICVSINEQVVHGIPGDRMIRDGDIVSIDAGVKLDGFYGDAAFTFCVGSVSPEARRLVEITKKALDKAIAASVVSNRLSDVSYAVQETAEAAGFSVVRDFVGHGIGRQMHEDPPIPNYGPPNKGPRLKAGMVLAIEPMVNMGTWEVVVMPDGWTALTKDRMLSAHFEHTVAVTENGPDVLTRI
jgi:methionyl aminopeptidase